MFRHVALLACLAAPAAAECPAKPDTSAEEARLSSALSRSSGPAAARQIQDRLWLIWMLAPDARAQEMLDRGLALRARSDIAGSRAALDGLVAYCPEYAEGYNQRAFSAFLARDYGAALADLETVLGMNADHVPARAGLAMTLMGLGRTEAAQEVLRDAVRRNPWLAERALLTGPPEQEL